MSASKREAGTAAELSTYHQESEWNERPGRKEIPSTAWQQAHTQSLSDEDDPFPEPVACDASEGWPQQSWADHTAPAAIIPLATTTRRMIPLFLRYRIAMAGGLSQMSLREVNNRCPAPVIGHARKGKRKARGRSITRARAWKSAGSLNGTVCEPALGGSNRRSITGSSTVLKSQSELFAPSVQLPITTLKSQRFISSWFKRQQPSCRSCTYTSPTSKACSAFPNSYPR